MHLSEYLYPAATVADLKGAAKEDVLRELAQAAAQAGLDEDAVFAALLEREQLGSTAVGSGYAIPHGKLPGLEKIVLVFARSVAGVDFSAPDGLSCHLFFVVLAPEGAAGHHLGLLGSIARLTKDAGFTGRLMRAKSAEELQAFLLGV